MVDQKLKNSLKGNRKQNYSAIPKQLLPSIHNKTHFKAATSIFLKSRLENSLKDRTNYLSRALRDVSPQYTNSKVPENERALEDSNQVSKPSNSIIKRDQKSDKKLQQVSFVNNDLKQKSEDGARNSKVADSIASGTPDELDQREIANAVTKTVLEQCNIIRHKHPNSKKLDLKSKLESSLYGLRFGRPKYTCVKRNNQMNKTADSHQVKRLTSDVL
jgi:hypothetical protein